MMDATSALSPSSLSLPSQMWPFGKSATGNKRGWSERVHRAARLVLTGWIPYQQRGVAGGGRIPCSSRTRSKMKSKFNEPMWRAKVDVFNLN